MLEMSAHRKGEAMRVLIFGASGMVGQGVLLESLRDSDVEQVVTIGRSSTGAHDAKLNEVVHADLTNYTAIAEQLADLDACFFCLGVSSAGMTEEASADSAAPRAELVKAVEPTSADAPHQGQQFIVLAAWQEVETSVTQTSVTRTRAIADYDTGAGAQQQAGDTASQPATTHATEITVTRIILLVYSPSPAAPTQPAPATVSHSHRPATQSADTGRMGLQL